MWIFFAVGSAFFAGITSVLAKCGMKDINSNIATALRTVVVFLFSWFIVFAVRGQSGIWEIPQKSVIFLVLSGISTGASWLCYFHALKIGDINKVAPVDKSSVVLTMLLAFIFLGEPFSETELAAILLIGAGIFLMIEKKKGTEDKKGRKWFLYAFLSALFASLTSILAKVGIENINSNLGTAIRTGVVLVMAWIIVLIMGKQKEIRNINRTNWIFLVLSGISTGISWMCYYRALKTGPASVVVPIDKLSILVTIVFSYVVFEERLSKKAVIGLLLLLAGTFILLI